MPYATNDGVRIYYEVEVSGPPLVLHVGFLSTLDDLRREDTRYTEALRDTYQLILLDPRGQGRSDKPHDPNAFTRAARAGDIRAVLDDLSIARTHFWGYSLGGSVGFASPLVPPSGCAPSSRVVRIPITTGTIRPIRTSIDGYPAAWRGSLRSMNAISAPHRPGSGSDYCRRTPRR